MCSIQILLSPSFPSFKGQKGISEGVPVSVFPLFANIKWAGSHTQATIPPVLTHKSSSLQCKNWEIVEGVPYRKRNTLSASFFRLKLHTQVRVGSGF